MKRVTHSIIIATAAVVMATTSWGTVIPLQALMNGAHANAGAGTGSLGTGLMTGTFDDASNLLSWDISWSGLSGTPNNMHFHGPATVNQNAGVEEGIGFPNNPMIGSTVIDATQAGQLLSGPWYVNLHSTVNPGGEIRGQLNTGFRNHTQSRCWQSALRRFSACTVCEDREKRLTQR